MPLYEYACPTCGDFTAMRSFAYYAQPHTCPDCGVEAPRVTRTAPAFSGMAASQRKAHSVNELSSHQPKLASEQREKHGPGCGCCGTTSKKNTVITKTGEKGFPNKRPWMISH